MKKLRNVLTVSAFILAVAGAAMTPKKIYSGAYGFIHGECMPGALTDSGCGTSGQITCTVFIEGIGETDAYQWQFSQYSCAVNYTRN